MTLELSPAVVDTNVIVSAYLFPNSKAGEAFRHVLGERRLLRSEPTLAELQSVMVRAKFEERLSLSARLRAVVDYETATRLVEVKAQIFACRDPRDDKFLELAVSGGADLILTGDADLLALHPFRGIAILTPAAYLASVAAPSGY